MPRGRFHFIPDPNQPPETTVLAKAAKLVGMAKTIDELRELEDRPGVDATVLKAAVGAGTTLDGDTEALVGAAEASTSFYAAVQDTSILFSLLQTGAMIQMPSRTRLVWSAAEATAAVRGEGRATRLTSVSVEMQGLEPTDAAALIVVTDELLRTGGPEVEALIDRLLRRATAYAADAEFLDQVIDGDTPTITAEPFSDHEDVIHDLRALLEAVAPTEDSRLMLALHPQLLRNIAFLTTAFGGGFLFGGLNPIKGGEILGGLPVMPCAALAPGEAVLLDGSGLVGNAGLTRLKSTQAAVEMVDEPAQDGTTGAGAQVVSLWQNNLVGLISRVEFAAARLRDTAVAKLTGATWGHPVNGS